MYASASKTAQVENNETFTRQGSLRRVLPSEPNKENLFGRQNEDLNKFYKKVQQEYVILAEYKMLQNEDLNGVYVIPSNESSFLWFGVVFVRRGLYEDGVFRFNIVLPTNFPDGGHPSVVFQSEIIHPVIHKDTNELSLKDAFPLWNKGAQHIWQILKYIYWIFDNFNSSLAHAVNLEAVQMYKNELAAYKEKVAALVKQSQDRLCDPPSTEDKHYIMFSQLEDEQYENMRAHVLRQVKDERKQKFGYSWVATGSFKPLSKQVSADSESDS